MRRKEESSKQGQTNNKAKQHSTPKAVNFPKKNELPRVGLEPTRLYIIYSSALNTGSWQVLSQKYRELPASVCGNSNSAEY